MNRPRLRTVVVGFGKMARGYADDAAMGKYYPFATHAQVLVKHPLFEWVAVIDPSAEARRFAQVDWSVPASADVAGLGSLVPDVEVAVLATPPDQRLELIEQFPNLKAVLVEKPLGTELATARRFLDGCAKRGVRVQVNLWRRADERFQALARQLDRIIGRPQAVSVFYGNGLLNNGTHMVDMVRMWFGEVTHVQRIGAASAFREGPIVEDDNPSFVLSMQSGLVVAFHPLLFAAYRENGLIAWGEGGRIDVLNEGLTLRCYSVRDNRAMTGEREVASDAPEICVSTVGNALYRMYDNLADALVEGELCSPGDSALETARIVDTVRLAAPDGRLTRVTTV